MAEVRIIFPKSGEPIVQQAAEVAPRGEPLTWCILSANKKIKSVEVEFEDTDATFFDNTHTPRKRRVEVKDGQADFYGHVPNYPAPLKEPKIAKYTIRGYDAVTGGKPIPHTVVDPVIITPQP